MESDIKVTVIDDGQGVVCETDMECFELTAQEAYDLHQALGAILSQCVQPFEPYPRQ